MHFRQTLAPGFSSSARSWLPDNECPRGQEAAGLTPPAWFRATGWKFAIRAYRSDSKPRTCDTMASNMLYEPFE